MVLSFSYSPQHNLLGPTMPRLSRRSIKALELKKKEAPKTLPPVEKKEKWPHAYQRLSDTRQYYALEDYFWFYEEWSNINKRFVKKFGKRLQDMLMELQYTHRVKLENKVVMDNVKRLSDFILPDDWEANLRSPCEIPPKAGPRKDWQDVIEMGDKLIPEWKLVERIGYADIIPRDHKFFEHSDAHVKTRKEDWTRWEKYCASMAERLRNEEPHYPEFPYLKVFGESLRARLPKKGFKCKDLQKVYQPSPIVPEGEQRPVYHEGPVGYLSPPWLHFACRPGAVTGRMVKLENVGSTALFYKWERRPLESMGVTTPRRTLGVHVTNCRNFTVMNGSGSVLPGEAREFIFRFSSDVEGFFMESWVLRVAPRMRRILKPLYLKGVATLKPIDRSLFNKMTQALNHRELMRGIGESLESIQDRAYKLSRRTEEFRNAEYMFSSEAFNFIKKNLSVVPPIYFTPSVYTRFDILVKVLQEILLQQPPIPDPPPVTEQPPANDQLLVPEQPPVPTQSPVTEQPPRHCSATDETEQPPSTAENEIDPELGENLEAETPTPPPLIPSWAFVYKFKKDSSAEQTDLSGADSAVPSGDEEDVPRGSEGDESGADHPSEEEGRFWDGAVMPISQVIALIEDEEMRELLQQEFTELLAMAQIPPHQTALLHFQMYHTLHNLAAAVDEIFVRVEEDETIRPTAERLIGSFYINYLKECAEKEQQDLLDAESVKTFGSKEEKSELVEYWETELKHEVEVASPAENQEMLMYCFKWIQIMTELRCAMPDGFNYYQRDVEREQAAVMDLMNQRMADTSADDETKCWNIFSLERHKTELLREQRALPKMAY